MAALPFVAAVGAIESDKEVVIGLVGEAAYLAKKEIAQNVLPIGFPPISELIEKVKGKAQVFV